MACSKHYVLQLISINTIPNYPNAVVQDSKVKKGIGTLSAVLVAYIILARANRSRVFANIGPV